MSLRAMSRVIARVGVVL